jgi:hypothetical protein
MGLEGYTSKLEEIGLNLEYLQLVSASPFHSDEGPKRHPKHLFGDEQSDDDFMCEMRRRRGKSHLLPL